MSDVILDVQNLKAYFHRQGILPGVVTTNKVVDGVTFQLERGKTLGIVGESGCGKSVLLRAILHLEKPTAGKILFDGQDIAGLSGRKLREVRRKMQIIFQNPYTSLHPRMTVGEIISEPMAIYRIGTPKERLQRAQELMELVGLEGSYYSRYPHQFSGGQRQRIGVARAIALDPELLLLDEPVSALDVSIQAQVLNLFNDIQGRLRLTYVFVAHDLAVLRHVSDRIAVMLAGKFVEMADFDQLYTSPLHPYTKSLLLATPSLKKGIGGIPIEATESVVGNGEKGEKGQECVYVDRCPEPEDICRRDFPLTVTAADGHTVSCHQFSSIPSTSRS